MSRIYTLNDIVNGNQELQYVMQVRVLQFTVEFLQQGGPKPHVILKMNFDQPISLGNAQYSGCRISMEYVGGGSDGLQGDFQIKLINYQQATVAAHAAFQFELLQRLRLSQYIDLFRDRAFTNGGDLTRFKFVQATMAGALDGCRDFITQCFIRLYQNRIVGWEAIGVVKGDLGHNPRTVLRSFYFHDLIGNDYRSHLDSQTGRRPTIVIPLPLHRGTFLSGFQRIENLGGQCPLPYIP